MRDPQRKLNLVLCCVALATAAILAPQSGSAQSYPNKAIRLIVPFAAGGNTTATENPHEPCHTP